MSDYPNRPKQRQFIYTLGLGIFLVVLWLIVVPGIASASPKELGPRISLPASVLQITPTSTLALQLEPISVYTFSLAALGYEEKSLISPYGQAEYFFRLPQNWAVQADGTLDLDLSYTYHQALTEYPPLFGDLTVKLDGQTLRTFSIDQETLEHYRMRLPLPLALLTNLDQTQHKLEFMFDAGFLCQLPHKAKLVIYPTSSISLNYSQRSLSPNLANYPQPFYQQAFEPSRVRFVLPSQLTANDLSSALAIAAKLGNLTSNQLVISATTDLVLSQALSPTTTPFNEHLIIIGRPQDNRLLPLLDKKVNLPVSLHQRQLGLVMQGPAAIAPGDTFTYVFTVTNTTTQTVRPLLVNPWPAYAEFVNCEPDCAKNNISKTITSKSISLAPNKSMNLSLTLRATNTLTGVAFVENTATLIEADLGPVNADTLTATIVTNSTKHKTQLSVTPEDDYFFVYNGLAVAKADGIVQEILSPWSQNRAILVVTGLSDEAVRKASQALGSNTRFPGMNGPVALVKDVMPPATVNDKAPVSTDMTFADLGYQDQVLRGEGSTGRLEYYFTMPYGWNLTDEAYIDLYFNHSQRLNYKDSGLTVLLDGKPVTSIPLDEKTATDGYIRVKLAENQFQEGKVVQLVFEVTMSMPEICANPAEAWFLVKDNSKISLAHREISDLNLALNKFPYPFHLNPALTDLLFVLPASPVVSEWEVALRLAAGLGNSAKGATMAPVAILGDSYPSETLANYHLLAIGRPSRNPLTQQVNEQLPQPFLPASDDIRQHLDNVIFRLPPGVDLGYLQLIPSPWNNARAFMAVTGTTDQSVNWAGEVLAKRTWELKTGNLALVKVNEVSTIDTRQLTRSGVAMAVATSVPGITATVTAVATATATTVITPTASPSPIPTTKAQLGEESKRPGWLIPLVGVTGVVVIAIFALAFWQARRRTSK